MKILQEIHLIMWQQWYKAQQVIYDENKLQKAWMMEILMNDSDISMKMNNGLEQASEDYKKFLYARATHSNHVIQYHMQQIIERQKVVNEYRSMMMEGMSLIPLEWNSYKMIW